MDKTGARGRAAKIVSTFLASCLEQGMVAEILAKEDYTPEEAHAIIAEIKMIQINLDLRAHRCKTIEHGHTLW